MARISLAAWGSHGDVDPFVGLAIGLRKRGHDVTVATMPYFRPLVEGSGLSFASIRPALNPTDASVVGRIMDPVRGPEFLLRQVVFPAVDEMYDDLAAATSGADLMISHPLTFAAPVIAEQLGTLWASAVLAPMSFFSRFDVPVIPQAPWLKSLERFGPWVGDTVLSLGRRFTSSWPASVRALRSRVGLGRGADPLFAGQHSPHLVLALFSRVLADPQPDWPARTVVTGHMLHDAPHGTLLVPELESFLAAGVAPVTFTLGSSAVLRPGGFWRESVDAVRALGCRAVLLVGPGGAAPLGRLPPTVIAVERAPHSLLFPRSAAVVQQCGIGTLAQSLRSGRPMLGVPFAFDQPDNAFRASRLGMARVLPAVRYRARLVTAELKALLEGPAHARAAERVAAEVRAERGVEGACDVIEATFGLAPPSREAAGAGGEPVSHLSAESSRTDDVS